jgi:hypothetical protein
VARWRWLIGLAVMLSTACAGSKATSLRIEIAEADRDADVFIDGQYVGQVQEIQGTAAGDVLLGPGVHRLEIRKPGRFPVQKTLQVTRRPEKTTTVDAELLVDPP